MELEVPFPAMVSIIPDEIHALEKGTPTPRKIIATAHICISIIITNIICFFTNLQLTIEMNLSIGCSLFKEYI